MTTGRWLTAEGAALARQVLRRLADDGDLAGLALPVVEGRPDLRELPGGGLITGDARLAGLDLRRAWLFQALIEHTELTGCRLDGADLSGTVLAGGSVTGCSMTGAKANDLLIADGHWEGVDLTGARANHVTAERTTFVRCTFPRLAKAEFRACSFEECRFTGPVRDCQFLAAPRDVFRDEERAPGDRGAALREFAPGERGDAFRDVEFASDDLRDTEFHGMDFESVRFPESDRLIVIPRAFRAVARRADRRSASRTDEIGREFRRFLSSQSLQRPEKSETAGWAIDRRGLGDIAGFAAETLYVAQNELRAELVDSPPENVVGGP
ncbi:pentapeptide repeat-containing protein [Actinoplanes sp. CA-030573]|uniref:pentapeptide repeat-containing protein n=1 Tax=Actinoplanes sp. CA-030573 TaxID=3239898 RepID=UPI003D90D2D9